MIKPIVPGCLALIQPARVFNERNEFIGERPAHTIRVVAKYSGGTKTCKKCKSKSFIWEISSHFDKTDNSFSCACRLTRIDGGDPDAITETEKEKEHAHND